MGIAGWPVEKTAWSRGTAFAPRALLHSPVPSMTTPLHLLLAIPAPASDLLDVLRRAGYDPRPRFVAHPSALHDAVGGGGSDVLVVQHGQQGLSSWDALAGVARHGAALPVIVLVEEPRAGTVVALLDAGARDVVDDLDRLGIAVAKALRGRPAVAEPVPPKLAEETEPTEAEPAAVEPAAVEPAGAGEAEPVVAGGEDRVSDTLCAFADAEALLRAAEATGLVLYRRRLDGAYAYLSPSAEAFTGYAEAALDAHGGLDALIEHRELLDGEDVACGPYHARYRLRAADGGVCQVEDHAHPWKDAEGDIVGTAGVLRDVTAQRDEEATSNAQDRRRAAYQHALTDLYALEGPSEEVFRVLTRTAAAVLGTGRTGLWLLDEDAAEVRCHALYVRDTDEHRIDPPFRGGAVTEMMGLVGQQRVVATADVLGKPAAERYGLDVYHARHGVHAVLAAAVRQEGRPVGFLAIEHLGETREWTGDEHDFVVALAAVVTLTLERARGRAAEEALRRSQRRYRVLSELSADYAYALRAELDGPVRIVWATQALAQVTGYTPAELEDYDGLAGLIHPEDRPAAEAAVARIKATPDETVEIECRIRTKSGDERWVVHRSRVVHDAEEDIHYVYSSGRDVTERKQFEADLVAARTEAEGLAQQKTAFLASMSHEIRTPLTGLLGFAGVLVEEVAAEHREFVELIETSGRRLLDTINSVLDLARLDAEQPNLEPVPLDLVEEARQTVRLLAPLAHQKDLALRLDEGAAEAIAPLDAVCLRRILNNLVGNAIKFTEQGEVVVGVEAEGEHVRLWVRDTGIGIDQAFLPHLFDEFRREAKGTAGGSGLGLALAQRLATLMDGTIAVESRKGEGSTFTLHFPRVFDEAQVHRAVELALVRSPARPAPRPEEGPQDDARPRVLVVEDNTDIRLLVERILGRRYRVEVAASAGEALRRVAAAGYDALVLDINLGGATSGLDVLEAARAGPSGDGVAALALTATALPGDRERLLAAGFEAYLPKPFSKFDLMETLRGIGVAVPEA